MCDLSFKNKALFKIEYSLKLLSELLNIQQSAIFYTEFDYLAKWIGEPQGAQCAGQPSWTDVSDNGPLARMTQIANKLSWWPTWWSLRLIIWMVGGWSTVMILIEVSQTCVKEELNLLDKTRLEFLMLVNTNFMKADTAGSIHENFVYQPY